MLVNNLLIPNKMNTYGYAVFKSLDNKPLHIVGISHYMEAGVFVFDNSQDARDFKKKKKQELQQYWWLGIIISAIGMIMDS